MRFNADDRATRLCNIFPEIGKGDINISIVNPGTIAAWHMHREQEDFQLVVKGALKVGLCNYSKTNPDYADNKNNWINVYLPQLRRKLDRLNPDLSATGDEESYQLFMKKRRTIENWLTEEPKVEWHILSEYNMNQGPLWIPPFIWHGSANNFNNEQAILVYHITNKWDGKDEYRIPIEEMGYNWERVAK